MQQAATSAKPGNNSSELSTMPDINEEAHIQPIRSSATKMGLTGRTTVRQGSETTQQSVQPRSRVCAWLKSLSSFFNHPTAALTTLVMYNGASAVQIADELGHVYDNAVPVEPIEAPMDAVTSWSGWITGHLVLIWSAIANVFDFFVHICENTLATCAGIVSLIGLLLTAMWFGVVYGVSFAVTIAAKLGLMTVSHSHWAHFVASTLVVVVRYFFIYVCDVYYGARFHIEAIHGMLKERAVRDASGSSPLERDMNDQDSRLVADLNDATRPITVNADVLTNALEAMDTGNKLAEMAKLIKRRANASEASDKAQEWMESAKKNWELVIFGLDENNMDMFVDPPGTEIDLTRDRKRTGQIFFHGF